MTPGKLTTVMCLAEILAITGFGSFPALMPFFFENWHMTGSEAGWINGAFFFGFMLGGPVLVSLTDRIDARKIFISGTILSFIGALGFATLAQDFWSIIPWRFLSGVALAATYMPGLKLLTDRLPDGDQSRYIAFYTAFFAAGTALSLLLVGQVEKWLDWKAALAAVCVGPAVSLALTLIFTRPKNHHAPRAWRDMVNVMPVLRNKQVMGYVIAYAAHTWELMTMRSFIVAFLVFTKDLTNGPDWMDIPIIATVIVFIGLPASILGNELSLKIGRPQALTVIMIASGFLAAVIGFSATLPLWMVIVLMVFYGISCTADSSSLTAGALQSAKPGMGGATMAVHSLLGSSGAVFGPIIAGFVLDLGGGLDTVNGWGFAFLSAGVAVLIGPLALRTMGSR
jgi:MFS family permease